VDGKAAKKSPSKRRLGPTGYQSGGNKSESSTLLEKLYLLEGLEKSQLRGRFITNTGRESTKKRGNRYKPWFRGEYIKGKGTWTWKKQTLSLKKILPR